MSPQWPMKHITVYMSFDYVTLHSSAYCILPEQPLLPLLLFPLPCLFLKKQSTIRQSDNNTIYCFIILQFDLKIERTNALFLGLM